MAKIAIVMMSADDYPEGRGRMAHVIHDAEALREAGHEVQIHFHGQGVSWLKAWDTRDHKFTQHYGERFDAIKDLVAGACSFCAEKRFDVAKHAVALGVPTRGDGGHTNVAALIGDGFQILSY